MSEPSRLHNEVVITALRAIVEPMTKAGASDAAVMVVLESVILGVLVANELLHGVSRRASVERLESAVQAVCERLGGDNG